MATHIQVPSPRSMALVLMLGAFIGLFGETALNMALTNVMAQFVIGPSTAQWLTTGYLLVLAILVPVSALLIRWFTTRQLIIGGFVISLLGAILAASANQFPMLMAGRLVQAVGTGLLLPVMMNVILLIFPIQKRGAIMGIMGFVITTAPAIGPTISGVIVSTIGWPWIFWISAIFYVGLVVLAAAKVSNVSELTKPRIDILSIGLSTIGFGGLIYGLSHMADTSLSSAMVWGPLLAGTVSLVLFVIRQLTMPQPMLNLRVFKYPMFVLGTLIVFIGMLVILSTAILLPIYLKSALLFSAAAAGLLLLPGNAVNVVMSPIIGVLFDKWGPRLFVIIGSLLVLAGNLMFLFVISATTPAWQIITAYIVMFFGIALLMMPSQTNGLNQLPPKLYADGSAVMNTLNQVAGAAGTAIAITLFTKGQQVYMADAPHAAQPEVLAAGVHYTFYFIAAVSFVALIVALFVRRSVAEQAGAADKA